MGMKKSFSTDESWDMENVYARLEQSEEFRELPVAVRKSGIPAYVIYRKLRGAGPALRAGLVQRAMRHSQGRPPRDAGESYTEKVYFPVGEHPKVDFVESIVGPRGSTLRHLESELGAKISVKAGEVGKPADGGEPPHCIVAAETEEGLGRSVIALENLVEDAVARAARESAKAMDEELKDALRAARSNLERDLLIAYYRHYVVHDT